MGWLGPVLDDVQHEGWTVPIFADGVEGNGSSSSRGIFVGDDDECRPDSEVTGWRAGCQCGWRGELWLRVDAGRHSPAARRLHNGQLFGADLDEENERVVIDEWRAHIAPVAALEDLAALRRQEHEAGELLTAGVVKAKAAGASWADIGRQVRLSRSAAHERWGALT